MLYQLSYLTFGEGVRDLRLGLTRSSTTPEGCRGFGHTTLSESGMLAGHYFDEHYPFLAGYGLHGEVDWLWSGMRCSDPRYVFSIYLGMSG